MRKLFWVLAGIMVLAAWGNIIGGTDTPVTASVDPGGGQAVVRADIPATPRATILLPVGGAQRRMRGMLRIASGAGPVARFPSPALRATSPHWGEEWPVNQPGYGVWCSGRPRPRACRGAIARRSGHARKRGGTWPIAVGQHCCTACRAR